MILLGKTYIILTCFIVNCCVQAFDSTQFYTRNTVPNQLFTLVNYEDYCLSTDYKWRLCPKTTYNLEDQVSYNRHITNKDSVELYNVFLSIPPNVPKSIRGLFSYWNWLLKNIPMQLYGKDLPMLNYPNRTCQNVRIESNPRENVINHFISSLDQLENKFYATTHATLQAISPPQYVNGISFAISGLFLQMALIALSTEVDHETRTEIDTCTGFNAPEQVKIELLKNIISWLPSSSDRLKFRYKTRLVLARNVNLSEKFMRGAAAAGHIIVDRLNKTHSPEELTNILNHMIEIDSGGAMRNTFEEEELSEGVCAVLITTIYIRARWRTPPTLLNGTLPFYDHNTAPKKSARMIRINDEMRYANLSEWDAEALEIKYATTGLTLVLIIPRGRSLGNLTAHMSSTSVQRIVDRMQSKRIAATLPIYTLRMTLLLPAKMATMGITRLVDKPCNGLKLSHAIQRIMFWAEAGQYAFKDDGIEWDETPEQRIVFDRPYIFYVRWHNVTLIHGNFVL